MIVATALDDRIDLHWMQPGGQCRLDAGQHLGQPAKPATHLREDRLVERVEADGDAMQSVALEFRGMLREQDAIGRQRKILDAVDLR